MTNGTTPTIRWRFKTVPVRIIRNAVMTIKCTNGKRLTWELETAKKTDTTIEWALTQEETMQLTDTIYIQLQYTAGAAFEGASKIYKRELLDILRKEPIENE